MELSHDEFAATWRHHFGQPVHPFAAALLASTKQTVRLKERDDEYVTWRLDGHEVVFTIGFILPCDTDKWHIQLPSAFYVWAAKVPPSQAWIHEDHPPGSDFLCEYAKLTRHPLADPFCVMDVILAADGVRLATFFGGERCK